MIFVPTDFWIKCSERIPESQQSWTCWLIIDKLDRNDNCNSREKAVWNSFLRFIFEFSVHQKKKAVMFYHASANIFWPKRSSEQCSELIFLLCNILCSKVIRRRGTKKVKWSLQLLCSPRSTRTIVMILIQKNWKRKVWFYPLWDYNNRWF